MRNILFYLLVVLSFACKPPQGETEIDPSKTYKLQLNPPTGSTYAYEVKNETSSVMEVDDKKIENETKATSNLNYNFDKDSAGNFLLRISYDNIYLLNKSGDNKTEVEANASIKPFTPMEKMLAIIREANISATMNNTGDILSMSGYSEIGDRIAATMDANDLAGRNKMKETWEQSYGDVLVKKNLDQLFKVFPDSSVAIGDEWKLTSKQEGEFPFTVIGKYKLKTINDKIAIIGSEGQVSSNNEEISIPGYGNATVTLTGEQQSEFEMEKETGMLLEATIKTTIEGTLKMVGREIPLKIKTKTSIRGKKK